METQTLRSPIESEQLTDFANTGYNNKGFINGNFLKHFQKDNSIKWHRFDESEVNSAYRNLIKIYNEAKGTMRKQNNEGELENDLINPIFTKVLGYSRRKKKFTPPGTTTLIEPDHLLFSSSTLSERFMIESGHIARDLKTLVCIAESKSWLKNLDQRESGRETAPVEQLIRDMRFTDVEYGIVTNGRDWRIYTKSGIQTPGVYFEIDLPLLCEDENTELFEVFYNFFSLDALKRDSNGKSHLTSLLQTASTFGQELESNLRVRMYTAMEFLTNGFAKADSGDTLPSHYESAMYMMYRILFALKAEDSNLLPIRLDGYRAKSLRSLCERSEKLIEEWDSERLLDEKDKTDLFLTLKALSKALDKGSEELGIKIGFNGGLFSELLDPKLLGKPLSNYYLANALVRCSRAKNPISKQLERIDFSSINYQHLGSVYEGLLQYEPEVADCAKRTVANSFKFEAIKKSDKVPEGYEIVREVSKGEIVLVLKEEARKNSGSYYTPQWVVNSSLQIGGLIEQIESANTIGELSKIKICDPAMGSGHFLVEVAKRLIERARAVCNDNQFQSFSETSEKLIKECIHGVDKNKLAVMLAKLNIWFLVAEINRKLPNLDSNFRYGNSLIFNPDAKKKIAKLWFDWTEEFEEVFTAQSGFNYVVGNPPWGGNISDEKAALDVLYPNVSPENLDSYDLFIRQALRLTSKTGKVIFIVPRNILKALENTKLRQQIVKQVASVADLGAAFEGVTLESVVLVLSDEEKAEKEVFTRLKGFEVGEKDFFNKEVIKSEDFFSKQDFNIYANGVREDIRKKIEVNKTDILGNLVTKSRGIEYGGNGEVAKCTNKKCGKYMTLPKKKKKDYKNCPHCDTKVTLAELQDRKYNIISNGKTAKHKYPIVAGRGIQVFGMKAGKYLEPGVAGINYKTDLFGDTEEAIFMTKVCEYIKCAFAKDGEYATQGVYVIKAKQEGLPLSWVAAVLNSEVFSFYHEYTINLGAKLTTNILLEDLMKYPIAKTPDKKVIAAIEKDIETIKSNGISSDKGALAKGRIDAAVAKAFGLNGAELSSIREFMSEIALLKSYVELQMKKNKAENDSQHDVLEDDDDLGEEDAA